MQQQLNMYKTKIIFHSYNHMQRILPNFLNN